MQKYRVHRHSGFSCGASPSESAAALGIVRSPTVDAVFAEANAGTSVTAAAATGASSPLPQQPPAVVFWTSEAVLPGTDQAGELSREGPGGVMRIRLPVPYRLPPERHGPGDTPWNWSGPHEGVDAQGKLFKEVFCAER